MTATLVRYRWIMFVILIAGLMAAAASLGTLRGRIATLGEQSSTGSVWFVTGVEFDLLRLEHALSDYVLGQATADDVNLKFDILWSRVATVQAGQIADKLAQYEIGTELFAEIADTLRAVEPRLVGLPETVTDVRDTLELLEIFRAYNVPMRNVSLDVLEASSRETKSWRDTLLQIAESNAWLSGAMGISVVLLVLVFGLDSVQSRRSLREKERLLEETQAANLAKSEFISVINHELRTPLASIKGAVSLINGNAVGEVPERFRRMLSLAERNCNHLIQLVNDLLDVEKFSAGKMEFHFKNIDLKSFLTAEIATNQTFANNFGVTIEAAPMPEGVHVWGDEKRLGQVLSNLLSNAAKFSKPDSTIVVGLKATGTEAVISVQDSGRGIPREKQSRLFEPFYQVDSSNERERGGTGLGLSIVKSIVDAHQGRIRLVSEPGRGTTFYIKLERVAVAQAA
ncbi:two-component hybrid sensor and regulator [Oceanicola granulosus HTCC2516]|uniref:histidine kinase n=1 Tax=Oceanicola granulosus (strain ATCC BAA-861 / DSM 15982 / KCTC 12143 / HTCC2516) TaxID=314256 RepID=Q2CCA4_OCEGH|nr:HAMP domain-containing sensor histidine kinase [Oceanicola granulosus]EAR50329.1 two-component hybrid sensor and regulator [Oceanicola granulosus HTCC2516]